MVGRALKLNRYYRFGSIWPSNWTKPTVASPAGGQTERQNSTIEAYLKAFVNFKQDDWARLLPMAKFAHNNAENASTGTSPLRVELRVEPRVYFKENVDIR